MSATLADIAANAGVSEATVSRVLNDRPGVSAAKRQAVLTALDLLGYERPARLRRRTGRPVGVILPEFTNPIYPAFAQALAPNFARRGFTPLVGSQADGGLHEEEYVEMFVEAGAAGIVFVSGAHADSTIPVARYQELRDLGLPLAFVNGFRTGIDAPFFSIDDRAAMVLAVRHLVAMGHTRLGLASGPETLVPSARKAEGFRAGVAEALGPKAEAFVVQSMVSDDGGLTAARALLAEGCTAIVCASDIIALGVLAEVRRQGLSVPDDVSVVGFDDSTVARHSWPPLTTVRQPVSTMSIAIADAFVGEMNNIYAQRSEYVYQPELVVRESSGSRKR
ncbi:HTH-type transcriptional regulator MalR [Flavimobilis marinus]|uniref:Transcriptional regulator, LacI family n=1 Tax=Flavimobilis marinus TaxID=285351 RepID=A0A1I2H6P8_9MICO|nr:LacI family DNA-binding transcriptional regulator [Flavimobilis marinus]GHG54315.1 HTH-type transcriptional regulator MalR [Flavimobilis marinus]SFF24301.1 transcriptional regulator, LacI family [Flavimobilis marinus]